MFNLSRYYSITSFIGIILIILALSFFFRYFAQKILMEHETRANIDITYSFSNSIWNQISDFVNRSMVFSSKEELLSQPEIELLDDITKLQMKGTNVVKVKIYNLNGLTVFSSEPKQIGSDKSQNRGFLQARSGVVASAITFRDEFYAFENKIANRDLIATYIPIRENHEGEVKAVFEVYSDVTSLVGGLESIQIKIISGVLFLLAILYIFLYLIVKRAHKILLSHDEERKVNEEKIWHQAYHDTLTELPNRNSFVERIEESLNRSKRHNKQGALLFLDLDRFKLVNDSLGHDAGDQLLRITASRILKSIREIDQAFRMSGDEFIVIIEDLEKVEYAADTAQRLLLAMSKPVHLDSHEIIVNMSIGISTFPRPDINSETLLKEADSAMYRAKRTGPNQFEFFSPEVTMIASERLVLENDLQHAFRKNQYILYYQTKVDPESNDVVGVEALLRWRHPEKGLIPPNQFIPLLEEIGLINKVGNWVILTACHQAQSWIKAGFQPIRMSVNISAMQFRNKGFVDYVSEALQKTKLEPKYLELELTESMFVENTDYAISVMHQLKDLGVKLSIDDFGSGYSSLNYLKQFPIDFLKIDQSFVKDLDKNDQDLAITTAISVLAQSLNLGITAEGVENENQVKILRELGCHELQGFLFCKPIPAIDLEKLLI